MAADRCSQRLKKANTTIAIRGLTSLELKMSETNTTANVVVETRPGRLELRTDNPWEEICGHTRAVRRGPFVLIAGTTASDVNQGVLHVSQSLRLISNRSFFFAFQPSSAYKQSVVIFNRTADALQTLGAQLADVVRVRMFV